MPLFIGKSIGFLKTTALFTVWVSLILIMELEVAPGQSIRSEYTATFITNSAYFTRSFQRRWRQ